MTDKEVIQDSPKAENEQVEVKKEEEKKILFNEPVGQYVYYHDTRIDMGNRLTGFLYLGKNKFIARTFEINTKKEVILYLEIKLKNNKYEINYLKNDYTLDDAESRALNSDLLIFLNLSANIDGKRLNNEDIEIENTSDENNTDIQVYKYSFWPPFFKLSSIRGKNEKFTAYSIIKIGIIKIKDDPDFFKYNEIEKIYDGLDFKLAKKKPFIVNLSGINVTLDENWELKESEEENNSDKTTYWISKNKIRYAQISCELINLNSYKTNDIYDFIKQTLYDSNILPESLVISINGNKVICKFESINKFYQIKNLVYMIFIQCSEKEYLIINFNSFEKMYQSNKNYFDKIIDDIIKSSEFNS